MGKLKIRIILIVSMFIVCVNFTSITTNAETRTVKTEKDLKIVLSDKTTKIVELDADITMKSHTIITSPDLTIIGNGHRIYANQYYYRFDTSNAKLSLNNVVIYNSTWTAFLNGLKSIKTKDVEFTGQQLSLSQGADITHENLKFHGTRVADDSTGSVELKGTNFINVSSYIAYSKNLTFSENSENQIYVGSTLTYLYQAGRITFGKNSLTNVDSNLAGLYNYNYSVLFVAEEGSEFNIVTRSNFNADSTAFISRMELHKDSKVTILNKGAAHRTHILGVDNIQISKNALLSVKNQAEQFQSGKVLFANKGQINIDEDGKMVIENIRSNGAIFMNGNWTSFMRLKNAQVDAWKLLQDPNNKPTEKYSNVTGQATWNAFKTRAHSTNNSDFNLEWGEGGKATTPYNKIVINGGTGSEVIEAPAISAPNIHIYKTANKNISKTEAEFLKDINAKTNDGSPIISNFDDKNLNDVGTHKVELVAKNAAGESKKDIVIVVAHENKSVVGDKSIITADSFRITIADARQLTVSEAKSELYGKITAYDVENDESNKTMGNDISDMVKVDFNELNKINKSRITGQLPLTFIITYRGETIKRTVNVAVIP